MPEKKTEDPWTPRLPELSEWEPADLVDGGLVQECVVTRADWTGLEARHLLFKRVRLVKCRFNSARCLPVHLSDVLLEDCDLSGADFSEGGLERVTFRNCRMTGFVAGSASLKGVCFVDSRLDSVALRAIDAKECLFSGCDMRLADFEMSSLAKVRFEKCRLAEASFRQSRLEEVDFRSSDLAGLKYAGAIKGATIDPVQLYDLAPALAYELGIFVEG
jgi:uncharacterized protein YjbI with pentapeptide repeats